MLAILVAAWVKSKILGQKQLNLSLFQPYEQCYNKCYVMYSLFKYRLIDVTLTPGDKIGFFVVAVAPTATTYSDEI